MSRPAVPMANTAALQREGALDSASPIHTVVIPTLALAERAQSLRRAIASALAGNTSAIGIVVVVNGQRFDAALVAELRSMSGVEVVMKPEAGSPGAILQGRRSVTTPFFSYLDDDDEYLPGAIDARLAVFARQPQADVVAGNGYRRRGGHDEIALKKLAAVPADPLRALFDENWLPSCGVAYRSATVPVSAFEELPRHIHWSFLAYRLALAGKQVAVLEQPGFVINDTPGSASKSETYLLCHVEVYERMLAARPPEPIRQIVAARLASARHEASDHFRQAGRWGRAWSWHLKSVASLHGWRYLGYTRHLMVPPRRADADGQMRSR